MDQRKKSVLHGMVFLMALALAIAGLVAEGGTIGYADDRLTGSAAPGEITPAAPELPDHSGGDKAGQTLPKGSARASGDATLSESPADAASQVPPVDKASNNIEPQADSLPADAAQPAQPSEQAAVPETSAAVPPVSGTGAGFEVLPPIDEETVGGGDGAATPPEDDTVETPAVIEPEFVRALTGIAAGRNDSNPVWSPSGEMIAFERSIGDNREIIVARSDGSIIQTIQCRSSNGDGEMEFFMPGIVEETSYNAGISWSPDESRLVFMSNGGSGNYDLYLLPALGQEKTIRLTENTEKDSHPHWNPVAERLAFVSGRTGKAEIYLMDLASRQVSILTNGAKTYLYPQWSPDGHKLALMYGSNENHDIYLIEDLQQSAKSLKPLTTWQYDDLRPAWSPDGSKIAFYSNYNPADDPKIWSIIVVASDGSDPTAGEELAAKVVAHNVVPDVERGPAWLPDSRRIAFVRNDPKAYNPIFITQVDTPGDIALRTETKMNHDVVCSKYGVLAFRSQTEQWDHIFIARLKEEEANRKPQ